MHETGKEKIVGLCDQVLIGKVLREGAVVLDLDRHRAFYVGTICSEQDVLARLEGFTSINAVGERSVALLKKAGLAKGAGITIQGVPHVQVYKVRKQ